MWKTAIFWPLRDQLSGHKWPKRPKSNKSARLLRIAVYSYYYYYQIITLFIGTSFDYEQKYNQVVSLVVKIEFAWKSTWHISIKLYWPTDFKNMKNHNILPSRDKKSGYKWCCIWGIIQFNIFIYFILSELSK